MTINIAVRSKELPITICDIRRTEPISIEIAKGRSEPIEEYKGDYIVTPLAKNEVVLQTEGKKMRDNVTILKVPYFETSNLSGGNTVYIGEIE